MKLGSFILADKFKIVVEGSSPWGLGFYSPLSLMGLGLRNSDIGPYLAQFLYGQVIHLAYRSKNNYIY